MKKCSVFAALTIAGIAASSLSLAQTVAPQGTNSSPNQVQLQKALNDRAFRECQGAVTAAMYEIDGKFRVIEQFITKPQARMDLSKLRGSVYRPHLPDQSLAECRERLAGVRDMVLMMSIMIGAFQK